MIVTLDVAAVEVVNDLDVIADEQVTQHHNIVVVGSFCGPEVVMVSHWDHSYIVSFYLYVPKSKV